MTYKWNIHTKIGYFMILKSFFYGTILYNWFTEYKYNVNQIKLISKDSIHISNMNKWCIIRRIMVLGQSM